MAENTDSAVLAGRLNGQTIIVPDLRRMMSHWPSGKNEHAPDVEQQIGKLLERTASAKDRANIMEANPVLLASCLWPNASKDQLAILTLMVLWQGRLDDYIEALEYQNSDKARDFRAKTKEYIAHCLQLSEPPREAPSTPSTTAVSDFQHISQAVCKQYDQEQRRALRVSLFEYLDSTIKETRYIQSGKVPTSRYYEDLRKKTGGAGPLCALAEFASGAHLSSIVVRSTPYKLLLEAVSVIVGLTNDLLSLSKELRKGRTLNAVPVLLWNDEHGDLDSVVNQVVGEIQKAVREFDIYETRLLRLRRAESDEILRVTATLKTICTGNLAWSLESKRYCVGGLDEDGNFRLELKTG